jgi:hypothetical protein
MRALSLIASSAFALTASAAAPAVAPAGFTGTWDLVWQTRHGPDRNGFLVIARQGNRLIAEIHGKGAVKAKGEAAGNAFILRGSRMAIPYTISGRIEGDRMEGNLHILSITRYFTGSRRPVS